VSSTFHGRDVFGPVAGALVRGTAFSDVGPIIDDAFHFEFPEPRIVDSAIEGTVIYIDTFGNLVSTIGGPAWAAFVKEVNGDLTEMVAEIDRVIVPVVTTFGDVPEDEACAYLGSTGRIEIAVNQGSAAKRFAAVIGAPLRVKHLSPDR
jgi:S-adenosylmethionine hydrolase